MIHLVGGRVYPTIPRFIERCVSFFIDCCADSIDGVSDLSLHSLIDALNGSAIGPFIDKSLDLSGDSLIHLLIVDCLTDSLVDSD